MSQFWAWLDDVEPPLSQWPADDLVRLVAGA